MTPFPFLTPFPFFFRSDPFSVPPLFRSPFSVLAGAGTCIGWLVLGHVLLWRMIRRSTATPEHVARMVDSRLRQEQRRPRVLIAPGLARPVTCGLFWPTILLPASLLRDDRKTQLRQVLLHELGHIHQGDGWGALLFNLALPLLYFHPLYWWLRRCSSLARELVADDWAARADGKEAYVTELIALARTRAGMTISPVGAIGILQPRSHFYRRMHMLLQRHQPLATRCSTSCRATMAVIVMGVVVGLTCIIGVRPVTAQPAPPGTAAKDPDAPRPTATPALSRSTGRGSMNQSPGAIRSASAARRYSSRAALNVGSPGPFGRQYVTTPSTFPSRTRFNDISSLLAILRGVPASG